MKSKWILCTAVLAFFSSASTTPALATIYVQSGDGICGNLWALFEQCLKDNGCWNDNKEIWVNGYLITSGSTACHPQCADLEKKAKDCSKRKDKVKTHGEENKAKKE
jgi:hypothetical protein